MTSRVSRYQTLLRHFPGRPWQTDTGVYTTTVITGRTVDADFPALRSSIAALVAPDFRKGEDRERRARQSWARRREERFAQTSTQPVTTHTPDQLARAEAAAQAFLDRLAGPRTQSTEEAATSAGSQITLSPESIELRLVSDESEVQAQVFPPLFICPKCDRIYYPDPNGTPSLLCDAHEPTYPLRQLNVVFSCGRCANIEPLLPFGVQMRKLEPGRVKCPSGHDLLLHLQAGLARAEWGCENPSCPSGINDPAESMHRVSRTCYCDVALEPFRNHEARSVMAPRSATSAEIASPLFVSFVKDSEGVDVSLARLRHGHKPRRGSISLPGLDSRARHRFAGLGVIEMFDVEKIQSILVNYGYRSYVHPSPDIPDGERYARFYRLQRHLERFRAYLAVTEGRGLVLALDQRKLAAFQSGTVNTHDTYANRTDAELNVVNQLGTQALLAEDAQRESFPLIKTLHAIEHALLQTLVLELGLEDFDSRILVRDGAILLFETKDLGDGGISQLAEHSGLLGSWAERASRTLLECPQACNSACIACVRINNADCHGFLGHEFNNWIPPNALIDRSKAADWMKLNAA